MNNNEHYVIKKNNCCACYACINECPTKCISMVKDSSGSLYPIVDDTKCINCNLCHNVCPSLKSVSLFLPKNIYAAYSKDENIREVSSSGGIAAEISKYFIQHGGIVYGAAMDELESRFIRVTEENQLHRLQGSKYVHSHIHNTYSQIKKDLDNNQQVLLIGLPCQIAGARSIFKNNPPNLLLVDILCHGAPSQDCFYNGIKLESEEYLTNLTFRDNNKYCLTGYSEDKIVFKTPYRASYYLNGFVEGYLFRENCYNCKYAQKERCGDITIGDFWGIGKSKKYDGNIEKGVNLVAVNTDAGAAFWQKIHDRIECEEREYEEAIPYNHTLQKPAAKPDNYSSFQNNYKKHGGVKALKKSYLLKTSYIKIRRMVRSNPFIYKLLTSLPPIGDKLKDYPE